MPGWSMSMTKKLRPWCLGTSRSVRASSMPRSAYWAPDVHTFCPLTVQPSPSRTARVCALARSEPDPGSEKNWHQDSSPRARAGRNRAFCSSLPWMQQHRGAEQLAEPGGRRQRPGLGEGRAHAGGGVGRQALAEPGLGPGGEAPARVGQPGPPGPHGERGAPSSPSASPARPPGPPGKRLTGRPGPPSALPSAKSNLESDTRISPYPPMSREAPEMSATPGDLDRGRSLPEANFRTGFY